MIIINYEKYLEVSGGYVSDNADTSMHVNPATDWQRATQRI